MVPMAAYAEDLAYIHDVAFGEFAIEAAPGLLGILRRNGVAGGLVVDLGCGSGIWARELICAGYDVLGVDISPSMIALARKKAPRATFLTASLLSVEVPPCSAVTSIGECLNYCFDPSNSKRQLVRLFRRVYKALRPGGVFVFDIAEPGQVAGAAQRKFADGEDWAVLLEAAEERKGRILTRRITAFRSLGDLYRRSEEIHRLRLWESTELLAALRRIGFLARPLRCYGSRRIPFAHIGILARKRGPGERAKLTM
jgi:SAM-dependent methyltransferase